VFLVTKKEGAWWWGMKEGERDETSEEPNTRRVRIVEPSSADQGRFPKNYVIEITQDGCVSRHAWLSCVVSF